MSHQALLPQNTARTIDQIRELLLSKRTIAPNGCWNWNGLLSSRGYGKIKWKGRHLRVHRVAAMIWLGMDLDDSKYACHHCDNPPCFNPDHLFIGTSKENQIDAVNKKRNHNTRKEICAQGHPFDSDNTYIDKEGSRHCRECHRGRELQRYRRGLRCA